VCDARIAVHKANVLAAETARTRRREILFGDFVETGRDLDPDDLFERILSGEDHRAAHARTDINEGRVGKRFFR
jgi:hypothetical protein